jgi:ATP-dependent DNA helicase RecG
MEISDRESPFISISQYDAEMAEDIVQLIDRLRSTGSDWAQVEAKKAAGGTPTTLGESLCSLANHPGGGVLILGLDEANHFAAVKLDNIQALKQAIGSKARAFHPPIQVTIEEQQVDGKTLIVANVKECPPSQKPCKDPRTGKSWVRSYDGDYEISSLEEQAFLATREAPSADCEPVNGATIDDLDLQLLDSWIETVKQTRPPLRQFSDRNELLRRTGVITADDVPTVAGLLVFGRYPQQYFPQLIVRVAITGDPSSNIRATSTGTFEGSIPVTLEQAMTWARENLRTRKVETEGGDLVDDTEFPLVALRELVANALVHRDYSAWSQGQAIEIRVDRDGLVIANPGGLYGITIDRLGKPSATSARNQRIVSMCQDARQPSGARVIEAIATGIQRVNSSVAAAGLPAPRFWDSGIRFTVRLDSTERAVQTEKAVTHRVTIKDRVYVGLAGEKTPVDVSQLAAKLELKKTSVRTALKTLMSENRIESMGGKGKSTTYQVVSKAQNS